MIIDVARELMGVVLSWSKFLHPASGQVHFGVAGAVDEQEQREVDDLIASFGFPPEFQSSVPAVADAAGTGPGAPADAPAPGQPDRADQIASAYALLQHHRCLWLDRNWVVDGDVWACNGCDWSGRTIEQHEHHLAELVVDIWLADARMALATNKFQK